MNEPETYSRISSGVKTHSQASSEMILKKITSLEAASDEEWEEAWAEQPQAVNRRSNSRMIPSVTLVEASVEVSEVAWATALEVVSVISAEALEVASEVASEAFRTITMTSLEVVSAEASTHSRAASHLAAQDPHQ